LVKCGDDICNIAEVGYSIATKAAAGSLFNYPNSLKFASAGSDAPFFLSLPAMVLEAGKK
jgi:hypothetical protein